MEKIGHTARIHRVGRLNLSVQDHHHLLVKNCSRMCFRPTLAKLSTKASTSSSRNWLARQTHDPYVKARPTDAYRSRSAYKLIEINSRFGNFIQKDYVRTVVDLGAAPGGWSQVLATLPANPDEETSSQRLRKKKASKNKQSSPEPTHDTVDELDAMVETSSFGLDTPATPSRLIIAVDLLPMVPIPGVVSFQGNFLDPKTQARIAYALHHGRLPAIGTAIQPSAVEMAEPALPDSRPRSAVRSESLTGKADMIVSDIASNFTGNRLADCQSSLDVCSAVFEFCLRHLQTAEEAKAKRGGVLL